ncbi:hypothetical protein SFRURICE_012546, partial [Spodoptera frugiperda]
MDITNNTALIEALLLEELPDCDEDSDAGVSEDEVADLQLPSPRGFDEVFERALDSVLAEIPPSSPSNEDVLECPINRVSTSPIPGSSVQTDLPVANTSSHRPNQGLPEPNRKWKKRDLDTILPEYHADTGVVENCFAHCTTPTDIFLVLIGGIIDNIVYQSNHYATQKGKVLNLKKFIPMNVRSSLTFIGKVVYFDNFFSSVALLEKLKTENTYACGTIRSNRKGLPGNMLADSQMKRGDSDHRFSNLDIGYWKWKDNKVVHLFRRSVTQGLMTMKDTNQKRKTSTDSITKGGSSKRRKSDYSTIKDVRLGNKGIHWP